MRVCSRRADGVAILVHIAASDFCTLFDRQSLSWDDATVLDFKRLICQRFNSKYCGKLDRAISERSLTLTKGECMSALPILAAHTTATAKRKNRAVHASSSSSSPSFSTEPLRNEQKLRVWLSPTEKIQEFFASIDWSHAIAIERPAPPPPSLSSSSLSALSHASVDDGNSPSASADLIGLGADALEFITVNHPNPNSPDASSEDLPSTTADSDADGDKKKKRKKAAATTTTTTTTTSESREGGDILPASGPAFAPIAAPAHFDPTIVNIRATFTTCLNFPAVFSAVPFEKGPFRAVAPDVAIVQDRAHHHTHQQAFLDSFIVQCFARIKDLRSREQYAKAMDLCEQVLVLMNPSHKGCFQQKGEMLAIIDRHADAIPYLRKALLLDEYDGSHYIALGKSLHSNGEFAAATMVLGSALALSGENPALLRECEVRKVRSQYYAGLEQSAMAGVQAVLKSHPEHELALEVFAEMLHEKRKHRLALQILLRLIVLNPNDKALRALVAKCVDRKDGIPLLTMHAHAPETAPALAFIGLILKDHSVIEKALDLYRRALSFVPNSATFCLNYVLTIEASGDAGLAMQALVQFLKKNPLLSVRDGKNVYVCDVVNNLIGGSASSSSSSSSSTSSAAAAAAAITATTAAGAVDGVDETAPEDIEDMKASFDRDEMKLFDSDDECERAATSNGSTSETKTKKKEPYLAEEIDLLALFYTACKLMFFTGQLPNIPRLVRYLEPSRPLRDLHLTNIRNEQAYFANVRELIKYVRKTDVNTERKIYMIGDTNALMAAWHTIKYKGVPHVVHPVIITGLKMWHLRDDMSFYPKAQFHSMIRRIPKGAPVILVFGETDCREGVYVSVEKGRHASLMEASLATINGFVKVIQELRKKNSWDCYIHPVPPVLNETRFIVTLFNVVYEKVIKEQQGLKWMNILPQLLEPQGAVKPQFILDNTHLGPAYIPLLERAIADHNGQIA